MKLKVKCAICKKEFDNITGVSYHIRTHNITSKEYYDKYMKKEGEGICPVCGNETKFITLKLGYYKHCSTKCSNNDEETKKAREETCLEKFGVRNITMCDYGKERQRKALEKNGGFTLQRPELLEKVHKITEDKYGSAYYLQTKKGQKVFKKSCIEHFGKSNPQKDKKIKRKTEKTNIEKYGFKVPTQNKDIHKKAEKTNLERYGVKSMLCDRELMEQCYIEKLNVRNPFQSEVIKEKIKEFNIKKYGVDHPMKNHEEFVKRMKGRTESNHGYLSMSEYNFSKLLKSNNIKFKSEYYIKNDIENHHFDFAIFKKGKLKCLVDIDGRYFHGLLNDVDGKHINGRKDYLRWSIVPKKVKFLIVDDDRLEEGIDELKRILPMKYKDWKKEMIRSIPKDIEDVIPRFDKKRLKSDWKRLCSYETYKNGAFLGKSILLHFCRSHWDRLKDDWLTIRKTLYKSPCSIHNVLEGLDTFQNPSKLRRKYKKKYKCCKEVVVKHHSPEKMLAICSLGKIYISKEPLDRKSVKIVKYLNLDVRYDKTNK